MTAFEFTPENTEKANAILAKYPEDRRASGTLPLLDLAQRQNNNTLDKDVIQYVADFLGRPLIRVYEVASFYTMFNLKPVGKYLIQLCTTTPCWLRGSDGVEQAMLDHLGIGLNETTEDGVFSTMRVECLGACVNAPMIQINDDYYEDLTPEKAVQLLKDLKDGKTPSIGSQTGRQFSAPAKESADA